MGATDTTNTLPGPDGCCGGPPTTRIGSEEAEAVTRALQVIGHPIRLQLLDLLARRGERVCVCDLEAALPVKQPTISHHLKVLRDSGLVDCRREANWAYYFVVPESVEQLRTRLDGVFEALMPGASST